MVYNTIEAEPYFTILGWILITSHIGFYFFHILLATPDGYESITLRLLAIFSGFLLVLHKYIPVFTKNHSPLAFYSILLFNFPFFFTYMLLNNQAQSSWQVGGLVGLMLLSFFVDFLSFIILTGVGMGAAFIIASHGHYGADVNLIGVFGSYSPPVIYFLLFSKKRKQLQEEKNNYLLNIKELNDTLDYKVKTRTIELEKALSAKVEFLNNVSHEIRTPIQGFTAMSYALCHNWDAFDDKRKKELALKISNNAERLGSFLTNILDLSKLTSSKMSMNLRASNLKESVENIINECKDLYLDKKQINLKLICEHSTYLIADIHKVEQVLRNLFVNAIKFSYNNTTIIATIKNVQKYKDHYQAIHFIITNIGIKIPVNELESIFDPFIQSTATKNSAGGTGLGLSICKKLIELHNGEIWAENNSDESTSFHFVIPTVQ